MVTKDYLGRCGSCLHCDLSSGYTFCYSTSFNCKQWNRMVKADEAACNRFEIARGRSNDIIAKYDR